MDPLILLFLLMSLLAIGLIVFDRLTSEKKPT